jgi:prepilin-type N-terminal cleavage/methylation domain-containing protein
MQKFNTNRRKSSGQWPVASGQGTVVSGQWPVVMNHRAPHPFTRSPLHPFTSQQSGVRSQPSAFCLPPTAYRFAFTLIELLVVIVILSIVTIATIPIIRPALDTRRTREAGRLLAAHITEAQVHAIETGRPTGVMFERLRIGEGTGAGVERGAAMNLYLCEVPPPYSGDITGSTATVRAVSGSPGTATVQFDASDNTWYGLLKPFDLIRFNYGGATYRFTGQAENPSSPGSFIVGTEEDPPGSGTLVLKKDNTLRFEIVAASTADPTFRFPPTAFPPTSNWKVPYQVLRQPVKLSTTPLQLPTGTVIDLFYSGVGSSYFAELKNPTTNLKFTADPGPLAITFSPSGALDKLYFVGTTISLSDPIYLLVGKREKVAKDTIANPTTYPPVLDPLYQYADARESQTEKHNFRDLENLWVSINPQTGLVTTAEVAELPQPVSGTNPPTPDQQAYEDLDAIISGTPTQEQILANAVRISRQFATSAQTMGGR